jgi:hypothetical protein
MILDFRLNSQIPKHQSQNSKEYCFEVLKLNIGIYLGFSICFLVLFMKGLVL